MQRSTEMKYLCKAFFSSCVHAFFWLAVCDPTAHVGVAEWALVLTRSLLHDPIKSDAAFCNHCVRTGVWLCEISAALPPLRKKKYRKEMHGIIHCRESYWFFFFEFRADAFRIGGGHKQALGWDGKVADRLNSEPLLDGLPNSRPQNTDI